MRGRKQRFIMSTGYEHIGNTPTFGRINEQVKTFDAASFTAEGAVQTPTDKVQRLTTVFAAVRPILLGLAAIPLIPPAWRAVLRVFIGTLDEVSAAFKAGKDLAVGGTTVEMEPKLPVG